MPETNVKMTNPEICQNDKEDEMKECGEPLLMDSIEEPSCAIDDSV